MKAWEYTWRSFDTFADIDQMVQALNDMGGEGWELIRWAERDGDVNLFKRRVKWVRDKDVVSGSD